MTPHVAADAAHMRALSIRQPFAELILRGIKTVKYRTRPTRIIGQRFHIYVPKAARRRSDSGKGTELHFSLAGINGA